MVKMSPVAMNMHPEAMNFFTASELLNELLMPSTLALVSMASSSWVELAGKVSLVKVKVEAMVHKYMGKCNPVLS